MFPKGFCCSGVEGKDVVQLLREALDRRNDVNIDVCAVLNDTTGCLMSCAWQDTRGEIQLDKNSTNTYQKVAATKKSRCKKSVVYA